MRAVLGSMVRRLDHLQMQGRPDVRAEAEHLRRQILHQEREINTRVRKLEAKHGSTAALSTLQGAGQIAALLPPAEAVIEYFVTEGRILAAVITPRHRRLHALEATPAALRGTLDHLRLQLDSLAATAARPLGSLDFLRRSAESRLQEVFHLVLRPLLPDLPARGRLTIIPHDLLHEVPFECLHDGADYVDASWQVTRCPTGDFFVERRRRRRRGALGDPLVIAGTRAGTPFVEEEARRIHRSWRGSRSRLLIDPSPAEALEAMRRARLIHLSAHGHFRADNPLFSTLHLGREPLFLADILETPLQADLAVLSACNSGQTFSGRGDALLGVSHAFLAAGTGRLVASLWRVHDQATAGWMESFHRTYHGTQDAIAAHHAAGRALRAEWPHPFYWGGFCILGS
jgi:CHAT domain-containing protein